MTDEELAAQAGTAPTTDDAAAVAAAAEAAKPAEPSFDDEAGAVFDRLVTNNGAERGEDGKFASPDGAKPADDAGQKSADSPAEGGETPGTDEVSPISTSAPAHLPQSTKDIWAKLPPEGQAEIARLTGEWDRKFGDLGKQFQAVKPISDRLNEAVTKYPEFKGMTPEQIAQGAVELGAVQVALGKNPVGTIIEIAKHYNVLPQIAQLFQPQGEGKPGEGGQPDQSQQLIAGLRQEISGLKQQLAQVGNPDNIRDTVSTAFKERETQTLVENFAATDGKEFWAEVEADIPLYIQHVMEKGLAEGPKDILQKAYDMAINANPEVRVKVREAEAKATAAANSDPQRAEAARRANSVNVRSSSNGKDRPLTEEEAMGGAYDRAMAN